VSGGVQLLAGLALNAVLRPKPPSFDGQNQKPQDGRVLGQDTTAARLRLYGRGVYAGQLVFQRAADGFLHRIIVHGQGPIEGFVETRLSQRAVTVDSIGRVLSAPYDHGEAGSLIRIETRSGEADQLSLAGPVAVAPEWTTTHRLRGLAYSWVRFEQRPSANQQDSYPSGVPEFQQVIDGANDITDPRTGTDSFTDNAALVIADWIEHPDGFNRFGSIDTDDLTAAANASEVARSLASGGTADSWRIAGSASLAETPETVLRRMLDACGGDVWLRPDGKIGLGVGGDPAPTITLTEDDVAGIESYDDGADALDRYTELPVTYVDEALDYTETTAQPWVNTAEETRIGSNIVGSPLDLRYAPYHAQARHAAKIKSARDNPPERVRLILKPQGLPVIYERTVTLDMPNLGLSGTWRVQPWTVTAADLTVTVDMAKIVGDPSTWSVAEEGAAQTLPPEQPSGDLPPAAPGDVQAFGQADDTDAGIFVIWMAPVADDTDHYLSYRATGDTAWISVSLSADATEALISPLTDEATYEVAVFAARSSGLDPDDPDVTDVRILGVEALDTTPTPNTPTDLSVEDAGGGVAIVTVTASDSASQRWTDILRGGVQVYRRRTSPGEVIQFADESGAGSFTWTARAVSLSEELSSVTAGVTETIT
jgi:hypothetical protein